MTSYQVSELLDLKHCADARSLVFQHAARTYSLVTGPDIRSDQILLAPEGSEDPKPVKRTVQLRPPAPVPDFLQRMMQAESEALLRTASKSRTRILQQQLPDPTAVDQSDASNVSQMLLDLEGSQDSKLSARIPQQARPPTTTVEQQDAGNFAQILLAPRKSEDSSAVRQTSQVKPSVPMPDSLPKKMQAESEALLRTASKLRVEMSLQEDPTTSAIEQYEASNTADLEAGKSAAAEGKGVQETRAMKDVAIEQCTSNTLDENRPFSEDERDSESEVLHLSLVSSNNSEAVKDTPKVRSSAPVPDFLLKIMQAESESLLRSMAKLRANLPQPGRLTTTNIEQCIASDAAHPESDTGTLSQHKSAQKISAMKGIMKERFSSNTPRNDSPRLEDESDSDMELLRLYPEPRFQLLATGTSPVPGVAHSVQSLQKQQTSSVRQEGNVLRLYKRPTVPSLRLTRSPSQLRSTGPASISSSDDLKSDVSSDRPKNVQSAPRRYVYGLVSHNPTPDVVGWGSEPLQKVEWSETADAIQDRLKKGNRPGSSKSTTTWCTWNAMEQKDGFESLETMELTSERIERWRDDPHLLDVDEGDVVAVGSLESLASETSSVPANHTTVLSRDPGEVCGKRYNKLMHKFESGFSYQSSRQLAME